MEDLQRWQSLLDESTGVSPVENKWSSLFNEASLGSTILDNAKKIMVHPKENYNGLCQRFAEQATGTSAKEASAIKAWNDAPYKVPGTQNMTPGSLVYFGPAKSNKGFGHVGIVAQDGKSMISATDNGIKESNIAEWSKANNQPILGYIPY